MLSQTGNIISQNITSSYYFPALYCDIFCFKNRPEAMADAPIDIMTYDTEFRHSSLALESP